MEIIGWDRVYRQQGQVHTTILPKIKVVAEKFSHKGYRKVLDLACGTGRHAVYLAQKGFLFRRLIYQKKLCPLPEKTLQHLM